MERVGPTGRSRCSRRSGGRSPGAPAARASSRAGCRATRARRGGRRPAGRGPRAVTACERRGVSTDREAVYDRSFTAPMLSCGLRCRPASRGGSAIDARSSGRPTGRGGSTVGRVAHRHPDHLPPRQRCSPTGAGLRRSPWPRTTTTRPGLPDPKEALDRPRLRPADDRLRPDRQGRARPPRHRSAARSSPSTRSRARCSTRRPRSRTRTSGTTRASTRSASSRPASTRSPAGPRGASTITQQLVRARLLPARGLRGQRPTSARSARSSSRSA